MTYREAMKEAHEEAGRLFKVAADRREPYTERLQAAAKAGRICEDAFQAWVDPGARDWANYGNDPFPSSRYPDRPF